MPLPPPRKPLPPDDPGLRELRQIQATMARALFQPLTAQEGLPRRWSDGRSTQEVIGEFIKPNARLTSVERVEIYSRSYWYRILDCLYDDFPGVRSILGTRKFHKLSTAYLARYPSESFTLRDLGSRLPEFIRAEPHWVEPHFALAYDTARFEWAQVVAFDNEARPLVALESLLGADPTEIHIGLQPYLMLLELGHPIDDFLLAVRDVEGIRSTASNAVSEMAVRPKIPRLRRPKPEPVFVAVHRLDNMLYYKRLTAPAFAILTGLQHGQSLAEACEAGATAAEPGLDLASAIREWFHNWASLGWLCAAA